MRFSFDFPPPVSDPCIDANAASSNSRFESSHARALKILNSWTVERRSTRPCESAHTVVAIPVRDERDRIAACVDALADQVSPSTGFRVLFVANDCTDGSNRWLLRQMHRWPFAATVWDVKLPSSSQSAGRARWLANHAAVAAATPDGLLFTTDADSCVPPRWISDHSSLLREGWDAVAGMVDIRPDDRSGITGSLAHRNEMEARYAVLLDEIESTIDPVPHDPWPRHFSASGANTAVRIQAVRRLPDFPVLPCGEDKALVRALEAHDLRVRHDTRTRVHTSGRLFGRAAGGMADTLRHRIHVPEAPCDERLERADRACQRARLRATWRTVQSRCGDSTALADFRMETSLSDAVLRRARGMKAFGASWESLEKLIPQLRRVPLSPHLLPLEIQRASELLDAIRKGVVLPDPMLLEKTA